ncbi:MAG: HNH endonuclease [Nannocystaceae bacterium]
MSFHKCFYCEQALGERSEVDHYVEVSEAPERAFAWPNLYLACFECNRRKAPNSQRSAAECLDPCEPTQDPAEHLTFEDEIIRARSASERGLATIQKYLLDREDLNYKRLVQLKHFLHALDRIRQIHERESRRGMSAPEAELLAAFAAPDHPFSLMFRVLLERSGFEDSRGLD